MKNKDKAIGMDVSDSKTLHSLQVAKLSSEVGPLAQKLKTSQTQAQTNMIKLIIYKYQIRKFKQNHHISLLQAAYKKGSKETQSKCHLPLDMMNFSHAKKAQALASDLDYRKKLHDYTVLPDDITVQQAKKAYQLQSDVRFAI